MKLNVPTVGPILGYTNASQARVWFRGVFERVNENNYRRCFGVSRFRKHKEKKWSALQFNKMSPNFDMSCVIGLLNLDSETCYEYQVGWILIESELENLSTINPELFEWHDQINTFNTGTSNPLANRSYAIGSCRYLLKTFIGDIFDDRGDKIFKSILNQHDRSPINGVMMMGDQIYADDLKFLNPDSKIQEFLLRYRTVFSQPYIRELMSCVPTYMILDDHEIEDNWPANADKEDWVMLYPHAMHAYQIYQCSHSPLFDIDQNGRIDGVPKKYWYSFSDGCVDWFVMDCRNERLINKDSRRMISQNQLDSLLLWLDSNHNNQIKVIVTSVPLVPDMNTDINDKWGAFPDQRATILNKMKEIDNGKVVILSGDVHCSFAAEIRHSETESVIGYQIVSSSFFWPYPHMNQADFSFGTPIKHPNDHGFSTKLKSKIISDDNFVRLDISSQKLLVSFYERKGERLQKVELLFQ